jgi:hypothetical protein
MKELHTIHEFEEYLDGVRGRVDHHGGQVERIIPTLVGAVFSTKDRSTPLRVRTYSHKTANVCEFTVDGRVYVLKFDHRAWKIALHRESIVGPLIAHFDNDSDATAVISTFASLKKTKKAA